MSESRRADVSLTLKCGEINRKYELFNGSQFEGRASQVSFYHAEQPNLTLNKSDLQAGRFVRVRCNGRWLPEGRRAMFPVSRVAFLIAQDIQTQLLNSGSVAE